MKEDLDPIKAQVLDPEGALATVVGDVSKLKKIKLSGYVQARYQDNQNDTNSSFFVRRARLKAEGSVGKATKVVLQIDAGGNDKNSSVTLKDAYMEYFLHGIQEVQPKVTMGQFKWPFGYEVVQSSGDREAPERSDVYTRAVPGEGTKGCYDLRPSAAGESGTSGCSTAPAWTRWALHGFPATLTTTTSTRMSWPAPLGISDTLISVVGLLGQGRPERPNSGQDSPMGQTSVERHFHTSFHKADTSRANSPREMRNPCHDGSLGVLRAGQRGHSARVDRGLQVRRFRCGQSIQHHRTPDKPPGWSDSVSR